MFGKGIILAVFTATMTVSASAAHLSDVQGAVFVNNQPVSASVEVVQGDRIKAVKGSATLVYSNGTAVPVTPGETVVVLASAPEPVSMNDGDLLPPPNNNEAALAVAGGVGLVVALSVATRPVSP